MSAVQTGKRQEIQKSEIDTNHGEQHRYVPPIVGEHSVSHADERWNAKDTEDRIARHSDSGAGISSSIGVIRDQCI